MLSARIRRVSGERQAGRRRRDSDSGRFVAVAEAVSAFDSAARAAGAFRRAVVGESAS